MLAETRIEAGLHHLQQCLLDEPVQHRRDSQYTDSSAGLFDLDFPDRLGPLSFGEFSGSILLILFGPLRVASRGPLL